MDERDTYDLRRKAVEGNDWAKDPAWRRLLERVANAAALASNDEGTFDQYIDQGFAVVEACVHTLNEQAWNFGKEPSDKLNHWYHRSPLIYAGKKRGEPYFDKSAIQDAIAQYLDLPYRVDELDRFLLDMSMAQEILAFADEMQPALKRKLPRVMTWLLSNLLSVAVGVAIIAFLLWIGPDSKIAIGLAILVFAIVALGTLWSLIAFPLSYPAIRRQDLKLAQIFETMGDAYSPLAGKPASTRHIEERVERATDAGVVWLAPMIVLLEDIRSRRKSI